MKKTIQLTIFLIVSINCLVAQTCIVNVDSLKGQYSGDCSKGKADGNGIATGVDSYKGHFKNGLPDGEGKYSWKNGNSYTGSWKNGLYDGEGTLFKAKIDSPERVTVIKGFWKKGKYLGRYEKLYIVTTITNNINEINIRKINDVSPTIIISVKSVTGGASDVTSSTLPKCRLTDIQFMEGRFEQQLNDETSSPVTNKYSFRQVTFPFYAIFSFQTTGSKLQTERVGIEILESGNWNVQISVEN